MAAANVLDERLTLDDDARGAVAFQPAHRSQPGFQPAVVGWDTIVGLLDCVVQRVRCQLTDRFRQRCRPVGDHHAGLAVVTDRVRDEPSGSDTVASLRHQHLDDLAVVIDGAVDVTPHALHLDVGFIDEPADTDRISERVGRVDQDRSETLHPTNSVT